MRQGGLTLATGRVRSKKKKQSKKNPKKTAPPKSHHESHSSPATKTKSTRRETNHVPRSSPYLLASIDAEFVEIGLVQLSQSVKTTNVTHTLTDTHRQTHTDKTDKLNSGTLCAPRYEGAFLPESKKTASVASLPRPSLVTSCIHRTDLYDLFPLNDLLALSGQIYS